jgi:hypothetical protein
VILFDVLKPHSRYELPFEDKRTTVNFLIKVYHGFKERTIDCNIRRDFHALVLGFDRGNESQINCYSMRNN